MLYGTLFMLAGAYALSRNGHVRGDFLYRNFPPTLQAKFDLTLYILFFFPAIIAFMISGWHFFELELAAERAQLGLARPGRSIWPFKFLIPLVGFLLLLQGLVEVVRCVRCIRQGALAGSGWRMSRSWRSRSSPPQAMRRRGARRRDGRGRRGRDPGGA